MATSIHTNGIAAVETERQVLEKRCADLEAERSRLLTELARLQEERAADQRLLYALTQKEYHFTQEEIFAQIGSEPPIEEIIANLDRSTESPT